MEKSLNRLSCMAMYIVHTHTHDEWFNQKQIITFFTFFSFSKEPSGDREEIETTVMYSLNDHFFDTLIFHV